MKLGRKLQSAIGLCRRRGVATLVEHAYNRGMVTYQSHRPLPLDPIRRARMLADVLNRWGGLSSVPVSAEDLVGARNSVLDFYLRHHFAAAAAASAELGVLRPIEAAVAADSFLASWDYHKIAAALPAWTAVAAGTPFAARVAQVGRRAALRLGRLGDAAADHRKRSAKTGAR